MNFSKHIFKLAKAVPGPLQQDLFDVAVPKTQKEKVLDLLRSAGSIGVSNIELNKTCFRYAARINDLRNDGHIIMSIKGKGSLWFFILEDGR